jgi:hypothetical protein
VSNWCGGLSGRSTTRGSSSPKLQHSSTSSARSFKQRAVAGCRTPSC